MASDSISKVQTEPFACKSELTIDWASMLHQHENQLRQTVTAQLSGGHEDAVDDIMQEVAIAAMNSASPPELEEKVLPWLRQIARHKIQDHWRKVQSQKRLAGSLEKSSVNTATVLTPFEWVMKIESRELVLSALDQLPKDDRDLLLQKYRQEKNCQDIARENGLSLKSIEYRLSKARRLLRKILNSNKED
ncbi:MAG: sigma-70 family RNA polymerase sigma factor [Verrucomicrobia bacterium]|nr:sigma-70 family RNA polymerase sigma factor [Verrucomicrobiota bacterium]